MLRQEMVIGRQLMPVLYVARQVLQVIRPRCWITRTLPCMLCQQSAACDQDVVGRIPMESVRNARAWPFYGRRTMQRTLALLRMLKGLFACTTVWHMIWAPLCAVICGLVVMADMLHCAPMLFSSLGRMGCETVAYVASSEGFGVLLQDSAYAGRSAAKSSVYS
ncbi:hypothetical protein COO60DRAFT_831127 [Scenedesmus sp. NREL 46B-D3]|nr:hypothetical protein COO60DRAFT_831127 [Scenedesmus sp. NREL 46B-D3]